MSEGVKCQEPFFCLPLGFHTLPIRFPCLFQLSTQTFQITSKPPNTNRLHTPICLSFSGIRFVFSQPPSPLASSPDKLQSPSNHSHTPSDPCDPTRHKPKIARRHNAHTNNIARPRNPSNNSHKKSPITYPHISSNK